MPYSRNYAQHGGLKLFDKVLVKDAIARIQALTVAKTGYTVEMADIEYEEARRLAMKTNQPSAAVSAISCRTRLYGLDKCVGTERGGVQIIIEAPHKVKSIGSKEIEDGM